MSDLHGHTCDCDSCIITALPDGTRRRGPAPTEQATPTRLDTSGASARFFYGKEIGLEDSALPFIVLGLPVPPRDQPVPIAKIYHHLFLRLTAMVRRHAEEIATANARILELEKTTEGLRDEVQDLRHAVELLAGVTE